VEYDAEDIYLNDEAGYEQEIYTNTMYWHLSLQILSWTMIEFVFYNTIKLRYLKFDGIERKKYRDI
jgi:hypothetical protein